MEKNTYKPCLIVGLGAVGVTIAARLQIMGIPTVFWGRSGKLNDSFDFKGWNKNLRVEPTCGEHKPFEPSDVALAFICVKAYDLEKCLQDVCARLVPGTVVISVSNGAVDDVLMRKSEEFTNLHWRQGLCAFGTSSIIKDSSSYASLTNLGYQLTSSQSQCMWGPLNGIDKIEDIEIQLLDLDQNIFFQYKNDVTFFIRRKWLYNTVMNTLCAVHAYENNGRLLENMHELESVYEESIMLYSYLWGDLPVSREKMWEDLLCFIGITARNENSMARDVRLHKRTESEFLAGLAVRHGRLPLLKKLHETICSGTIRRT